MATARSRKPSFDVDENMRTVVRMLMAQEQMHHTDLAEVIGVSPRTAYSKTEDRHPTPFKASEVYRMALRFGVPVEVFYRPPALVGAHNTTHGESDLPLTTAA